MEDNTLLAKCMDLAKCLIESNTRFSINLKLESGATFNSTNCDILKQNQKKTPSQLKRDLERKEKIINQKAQDKILDVPNANKDNVINAPDENPQSHSQGDQHKEKCTPESPNIFEGNKNNQQSLMKDIFQPHKNIASYVTTSIRIEITEHKENRVE